MKPLHSDAVGSLVRRCGPDPDDVLREMERRAAGEAFPSVGPEVGRTLAMCARLGGAESVLELGSGFGYSAYWIARALPADGEIRLTERDPDLLADARAYFERGGLAEKASFVEGDAVELAAESDGTFDLVVLDHDTADYRRGFDAVRDRVAPGGAVLTDNVAVHGDVQTPEGLLATLDGAPAPNERTRAVAAFLDRLLSDPAFETCLLPVGEGLAVSVRTGGEN